LVIFYYTNLFELSLQYYLATSRWSCTSRSPGTSSSTR